MRRNGTFTEHKSRISQTKQMHWKSNRTLTRLSPLPPRAGLGRPDLHCARRLWAQLEKGPLVYFGKSDQGQLSHLGDGHTASRGSVGSHRCPRAAANPCALSSCSLVNSSACSVMLDFPKWLKPDCFPLLFCFDVS